MTTLKRQEASLIFFFFSFFALSSNVYSFNITNMLSQHSDFSTFNDYLTKAQLVSDINSRQTITVLAVDNGNISPIAGQPMDTIKKILSLHVILDYYDAQKLQKLSNKTAKLTTLFQASGQATGQLGFLNVTIMSGNSVAFGSAVPGSNLGSNLVKSVASQPYNISIMQVSNVIMPPGIGNSNSSSKSSPPPPSPTPSKSPAPADAPPSKAPTPSKAPSPKKSPPTEAPSPSDADAPSDDADAPTADSPAGTPPPEADAPAADTPAADTPDAADGPAADADGKSAANAVGAKIGGFVSIFLCTLLYAVTMT